MCNKYFCSGLKIFQNLSPVLVLADENVLIRCAEVKGMNIEWELVGWTWCFTWVIELEMEKCFSGVSKVLWTLKKPTKQPTNNSHLHNSGKEENSFLPPFLFSVFSSLAGCGCTVGKAEFPAPPYKSTLQGVDKAEHCSFLEDGLMALNTELFPAFFCSIQGVNPKCSGQIPAWPIPFRWRNFSWQFWAYQHCSLILSYCERLFLKNSCLTGGWGIWRNSLQAQAEWLCVWYGFEILE